MGQLRHFDASGVRATLDRTSPQSTERDEALWFGTDDRPLFGHLHVPEGGHAHGAVVICPPLGYEYICSHRTLRVLAEALSRSRWCALRFDYDGTGDSAGGQTDPGRIEAWRASVDQALLLVRELGLPALGLVGMRFGALLAADAAARSSVDQLVLWDPVVSGRSYLRELALFGGFNGEEQPPGGAAGADLLEAGGLALDRTARSEIGRLSLDVSGDPAPILALLRPDRPSERLRRALATSPRATVEEVAGQDRMLDDSSMRALVPQDTVQRIVELFSRPEPAPPTPVRLPQKGKTARFTTASGTVDERVVRFGPARLFGILAERADSGNAPLVVCLNNAVDHHIGPARLWVDWGREAAASGFRVLRMDMGGIGDSPARPGHGEDRPYPLHGVEDVRDAVAALSPNGEPAVIVGLCSGAAIALQAAAAGIGNGLVTINAPLHTPMDVLYEVAAGSPTPPRLARSNADHRWRRQVLTHLPAAVWRARARTGLGPEAPRLLRTLLARGADVLMIYGEEAFNYWKAGQTLSWMFQDLVSEGSFATSTYPGSDHGAMRSATRRWVGRRLDEYLEEGFSRSSSIDAIPSVEVRSGFREAAI